jgi:glycosyltransferase involved in cell wall biosynthesis
MRIALITDAWPPQVSGAALALQTVEAGLRQRGHNMEVAHPERFRTFPCPTYPEIRLALRPMPQLVRILDAFCPEAVHIPVEGPLGLAGRRYCRRRKLAFTTSFMTKFPEYVQERFRLPASMLYPLFRWFHRPAARVMVSTPSLKKELEERGFRNLVYWSRGVDHELFRPREKTALDVDRPVAMYMGRVAVEKNVEAFLRLELPGTKVVIGDGPALEHLREAYPEALFLGRKTGEDLAVHLAAADVFVFPSLTDTFGIVLLEAMACGLPVAAFPVVGPVDVVEPGRTGWLDWDLQKAVHRALELNPRDCREHALRYTWKRSIDQFESHLARVYRPA